MYKKYIIEKKDLDNLPSSYKDVAINYSGNYSIIQKKVNEIRKLNKKINFLNNDIEILTIYSDIINFKKFISLLIFSFSDTIKFNSFVILSYISLLL